MTDQPSTQEAEKALELLERIFLNAPNPGDVDAHAALAALRSLRTQLEHTEWLRAQNFSMLQDLNEKNLELSAQHTKDQERIEELEHMNDEQARTFDVMAARIEELKARLRLALPPGSPTRGA